MHCQTHLNYMTQRTRSRCHSNRVISSGCSRLSGASTSTSTVAPPHPISKPAIISRENSTPNNLPRGARLIPMKPSDTSDTASAYFNEPPVACAEAGIAAVVLTFTTTFVSPFPDPTEPGVNEHVLSAGRPEHASVTSAGNVLPFPRGLRSRL